MHDSPYANGICVSKDAKDSTCIVMAAQAAMTMQVGDAKRRETASGVWGHAHRLLPPSESALFPYSAATATFAISASARLYSPGITLWNFGK